jgi:hypothetical protein
MRDGAAAGATLSKGILECSAENEDIENEAPGMGGFFEVGQ